MAIRNDEDGEEPLHLVSSHASKSIGHVRRTFIDDQLGDVGFDPGNDVIIVVVKGTRFTNVPYNNFYFIC